MNRLALVALVAAACSSKPGTGGGSGVKPPEVVASAKSCDDVKPRVMELYRAEAAAHEPARIDDAAGDNTAMVMKDCARDPAKRVPCLATVGSVERLEKECLDPLDEEGTEGEALRP